MRASPVSRCFGHGAANFRVAAQPLALVPPPSPLAGAGSAAATVVASGILVFAGVRALDSSDAGESGLRIVPLQAQVVVAPPEPAPVAEREPAPAPVVVAKQTVPTQRKPEPEALRAPERKPVRPAPLPVPAPVEAETRTAWRPPAAVASAAPRAKAPRFAIDAVAGPAPAERENPTRVASLPPGAPAPRRAAVPTLPRVAPLAAAVPTLPGDDSTAAVSARATPSHAAPERAALRAAPARPVSFAGAADTRSAASPRETAAAVRERVAAAPVPAPARRSEPEAKLRGVPLSTLAACRSDRREDSLKLAVLGAVGDRRECSSAAGTYRFVETKNLNAFLMWIERAPGRAAVDRCAELTHALSCLSGQGAK
ncbi:MAG: hypothetical protein FJ108_16475 [Deltaproteobacteria bacterium]|nr:hypothetical protein [Deltaproteobacteria bacterium]